MNTSVEFFEWLLHTENEDNSSLLPRDLRQDPCLLEAAPSLASLSDTEENSSLESDDGETFASLCSSPEDCYSLLGDTSFHSTSDCSMIIKGSDRGGGATAAEADEASSKCEVEEEEGEAVDAQSREEGRPASPRRTVSFKNVEVREYSITVGDHPLCYDGLPLTLDWEHSETVEIRDVSTSRERSGNYRAPRRLSFGERRDRLFSAAAAAEAARSGTDLAQPSQSDSRSLELNLVIKMLHNSWSMNSILPPPILDDIEEVEDDDHVQGEQATTPMSQRRRRRGSPRVSQPPEQVLEWKRVPFRRSNAFCE